MFAVCTPKTTFMCLQCALQKQPSCVCSVHSKNNPHVFAVCTPKTTFMFLQCIANSDQQYLEISSDPLYICTCDTEGGEADCSVSSITRSVYPGGRIEVPVVAYGQRSGTTPAVIHVISRDKITINVPENTQNITHSCTYLNYTVQSQELGTTQAMNLYGDGPCPPEERTIPLVPINIITVHISIRKCPPGFEILQFRTVCSCARRLQRYTNEYRIDDGKNRAQS